MSADISGPFASGKDVGGPRRYFVAFSIRLPVGEDFPWTRRSSVPEVFPKGHDHSAGPRMGAPHPVSGPPTRVNDPNPCSADQVLREEPEVNTHVDVQEDSSSIPVKAGPLPPTHRVRGKSSPMPVSPACLDSGPPDLSGLEMEFSRDGVPDLCDAPAFLPASSSLGAPGVSADPDDFMQDPEPDGKPPAEAPLLNREFVTLRWAEPLQGRSADPLRLVIMQSIARCKAFGIPVLRFHTDRAKEFQSIKLLRWLAEQSIHATKSAPEDPAANGTAEASVREIKRSARRCLLSSGLPSAYWPLAVRHASELSWRLSLARLGCPTRPLLTFGIKVEARSREWIKRSDKQWSQRTLSGQLVGPAPHTPSAYVVLLDDGHLYISSSVHPVTSTSHSLASPDAVPPCVVQLKLFRAAAHQSPFCMPPPVSWSTAVMPSARPSVRAMRFSAPSGGGGLHGLPENFANANPNTGASMANAGASVAAASEGAGLLSPRGSSNSGDVGLEVNTFPHARHVSTASFCEVFRMEGSRILQFSNQHQVDPSLRCLFSGFSFRVSMARFAGLPEQVQARLLQGMDSDQTSVSTPDPGYVDDVYPGFEGEVDSGSSSSLEGGPESGGGCSPMPHPGGDRHSNMPQSGGDRRSHMPHSGGDSSFSLPSLEGSLTSSSSPSTPMARVSAIGKVDMATSAVEELANLKLSNHLLSRDDVLEVIELLWQNTQKIVDVRPFQSKGDQDPGESWVSGRWTSGAFVHGGVVGLTRSSRSHPATTAFLCKALRHRTNHPFASLTVLVNCQSGMHVDSHNEASCLNVAWNLSEGPHVSGIKLGDNALVLPSNAWASFWPRSPHSSLPGLGNRILLVGYTPRSLDRLSMADSTELKSLGFSLPLFGTIPQESGSSVHAVASVAHLEEGEEGTDWEVTVEIPPDQASVVSFLRDKYVRIHALKTRAGRGTVHLAQEGVFDEVNGPYLASLQAWQEDIEQQLQGEALWREAQGDLEFQVRAIPHVPTEEVVPPASGLLHTRLVSNDEVRENLQAWKDAMEKEYNSLIEKGAIESVSEDQVQSWIAEGEDVEVLPGRGVASEKPQDGLGPRKKYRAVICGNFQAPHPARAKQTLYAGGADSVSIRTCLRWAGLRSAGASVVDVKTAFLNAPVDESEARYLICNPPRHMIMAGVVPKRTRWRVHGALYGLLTSPRAWSKERDGRMRKFRWSCDGSARRLLQCVTDPNVWRLVDLQGQLLGLVTCYVDDLLVLGSRRERDSFLSHLRSVWETSDPSHSEQGAMYCGLELKQTPEGIVASQSRYVNELLSRHSEITSCSGSPCSTWREVFDDSESKADTVDLALVREAQSLCGELLWLNVRARPELAFPISRMAQLATRRPADSISIGQGILKYLRAYPDAGILFGRAPGNLGAHGAFTRPVDEKLVQVFSDSSFGPASGRSHQGLLVHWAGVPISWESGRQSLVSLSTAESELIAVVSGAQMGDAVAALISELLGFEPEVQLLGDNLACISIISGPPTSWRSRHLRLRAAALRERLESGSWTIVHLPGQWLPADLLTKALSVTKFQSLLPLCGVHLPKPTVSKLIARTERIPNWKSVCLVLLLALVAQLLKGQALEGTSEEGSAWLVCLVVGVILAWEGLKTATSSCIRCLRCVRRVPAQQTPEVACQTDPIAPPIPQTRVVQVPQPIPEGLEAFFTATGQRWHQDYNCGDIRNRIASRYLPCERCTAHHLMLNPPDQPAPLAQQVPPPPQVRRRRPR